MSFVLVVIYKIVSLFRVTGCTVNDISSFLYFTQRSVMGLF